MAPYTCGSLALRLDHLPRASRSNDERTRNRPEHGPAEPRRTVVRRATGRAGQRWRGDGRRDARRRGHRGRLPGRRRRQRGHRPRATVGQGAGHPQLRHQRQVGAARRHLGSDRHRRARPRALRGAQADRRWRRHRGLRADRCRCRRSPTR